MQIGIDFSGCDLFLHWRPCFFKRWWQFTIKGFCSNIIMCWYNYRKRACILHRWILFIFNVFLWFPIFLGINLPYCIMLSMLLHFYLWICMIELVLNNAMQVTRDQIPGSVELLRSLVLLSQLKNLMLSEFVLFQLYLNLARLGAHSEVWICPVMAQVLLSLHAFAVCSSMFGIY